MERSHAAPGIIKGYAKKNLVHEVLLFGYGLADPPPPLPSKKGNKSCAIFLLLDAHFQPGIHSIHPKLPLSYALRYCFRCGYIADDLVQQWVKVFPCFIVLLEVCMLTLAWTICKNSKIIRVNIIRYFHGQGVNYCLQSVGQA